MAITSILTVPQPPVFPCAPVPCAPLRALLTCLLLLSAHFLTSAARAVKPQATPPPTTGPEVLLISRPVHPHLTSARRLGLTILLWIVTTGFARPLPSRLHASRVTLGDGLFEVGDAPVGSLKLVFEADDAGGGGQGHVLIKQFTDPGGQGELGAAVAALPTGGAARNEHSGGIQAAQKGGLHAEQVRGGADV